MIRVRNFEYTFRALGMEPTVGDFRRFHQLTVHTGFFSFGQRHGSSKLMVPPKGITKWKTKFFYIKAVAVAAKMTFRNVTEPIIAETIAVPKADTVDWFPRLRLIEFKKLNNSQLWVLRMMLTRMSRKSRPVVREKSGGDLGALGDRDTKGVPKKQVEKGVRFHQKKKHEPAVVPPLVPQGLGVPGGGAAAGGSSVGSKPADEKKKRKVEEKAAGAGKRKRPRLGTTRIATVTQPKPVVVTEPQEGSFSLFDAPSSPARDAAADVNKEFTRSPSVEVVTEPSAQAEDVGKKVVDQTIFDTVDSSDNLIPPRDTDVEGGNLKFADVEKQKSPVADKTTGSTAAGTGSGESYIQPGESELEFYYRTYTENRGVNYHRTP
ncbi:hypothetical protein HanIR_Chr03g0119981 [Helianthus annuus]|nr:hypothetical protein HanIR_Chr03g0119981 [Helianthus annuus]